MRLLIFFTILLTFLFSCIDENNELPDKTGAPMEGALSVSFFENYLKAGDTIDVLLDTVDYFNRIPFKIKNYGLQNISNLIIETNDSLVFVKPDTLKLLRGVSEYPDIEQKLTLNIVHGFTLDSTHYYLPLNWNHVMVSFTGKTHKTNNLDSFYAKMFVRLNFFVRYADFDIYQNDTLMSLNNSREKSQSSGPEGTKGLYIFNYKNAPYYSIENKGNCNLIYTIFKANKIFRSVLQDTLFPTQRKKFELEPNSDTSIYVFKVNSNNVVQNLDKKLVLKNGSSYFILKNTNK